MIKQSWILHGSLTIYLYDGKCLHEMPISLCNESDASNTWGAHCNGVVTGGPWPQSEIDFHINHLELRAAFYALQ